jgi:hypothetical protein
MDQETSSPQQGAAIEPFCRTVLKPYRTVDGVPSFKDSEIVQLFERAKAERLLPLVMYNCDPDMSAEAFLRMYKGSTLRQLWLVFYGDDLAGWIWIDDLASRTARSHFCLFRWVSQGRLSEEIGRDMFRQLFDTKFKSGATLRLLRAEMPGFNKPGLWFLENVGMKSIGQIPNCAYWVTTDRYYPMFYLYATKDMLKRNSQNVVAIAPLRAEAARQTEGHAE